MKRNLTLILMLCISIVLGANPLYDKEIYHKVKKALDKSVEHSMRMYESVMNDKNQFPRTTDEKGFVTSKASWWCSGFFPGTLWYLYEYSHDKQVCEAAVDMTERLSGEVYNKKDHDIGFKINCSFGNGYRLIKDDDYKKQIIQAAKSLATRFNKTVGCTRSWDRKDWGFCVIIDNMMNMELLNVASIYSGDSVFMEMAKSHADVTMANHFRPDYSCYHVVGYDEKTGKAVQKVTHQGYADNSDWARGQAWALYGYTMMYRQTDDVRYLNHAINIGKFIKSHPNMPSDKVPYWDFDDPKIPNTYRDASSAAIMASAYLELSTMLNDKELSHEFFSLAEQQLKSLSTPDYFAQIGTNHNFILMHSTGNLNRGYEVDAPLSYADYYYVEAMIRYIRLVEGKPVVELISK